MSDRLTGDERRIIQALEGIENNTRREENALSAVKGRRREGTEGAG